MATTCKKVRKYTGDLLTKFAKWQQQHWILSTILVRLLAVWFSFVLTYAGETLHLLETLENGKRHITTPGLVCTVLLILFVTISELSLKHIRNKDEGAHDRGALLILRNLRDSTTSLCESKYNTLVNEIARIKADPSREVPSIISNPEKQLDALANQMTACLCKLLQGDHGDKWRPSDIFVSIAYELPCEKPGEWHWATRERGLSLADLFNMDSDRISTMAFRLKSNGNKTFYNSKQDAFVEKHYIPDPDDEYDADGNLLGSIACYEDVIKRNDVDFIHYVLTISTYDKRFVLLDSNKFDTQDEYDEAYAVSVEAVKYNMYKNIVSDFSMRAKIEFCLLYLSYLKSIR